MNDEIRQPSTHLDRDRRSMDHLEDFLFIWGLWRNNALPELASMTKSTLHTIFEMHSGAKKKQDRTKFIEWDKLLIPAPVTAQGTNTQSFSPRTPNYWTKYALNRLDRAIDMLPVNQRVALRIMYEGGWNYRDVEKHYGWPRRTYNDRIKRAKKNIKKYLKKLPEQCINI